MLQNYAFSTKFSIKSFIFVISNADRDFPIAFVNHKPLVKNGRTELCCYNSRILLAAARDAM
jgi:hypothetical protein